MEEDMGIGTPLSGGVIEERDQPRQTPHSPTPLAATSRRTWDGVLVVLSRLLVVGGIEERVGLGSAEAMSEAAPWKGSADASD